MGAAHRDAEKNEISGAVNIPCLSPWERWPKRSEDREGKAASPSQSPAVTALPEGEPRLSKKWPCHFFEKDSLRSAPQLSADSGQFDAHSAQSVFRHAHVAAENELYCFRVCGRETLRGFFDKLSSPGGRVKVSPSCIAYWQQHIGIRNGAYLYRYAPLTVLRPSGNCRAARLAYAIIRMQRRTGSR